MMSQSVRYYLTVAPIVGSAYILTRSIDRRRLRPKPYTVSQLTGRAGQMDRLRQNFQFRRERVKQVKEIGKLMKVEKEQWEKERRRMEEWMSVRREETAKEARALVEVLAGIRDLWRQAAGSLEGEARRAAEGLEGRWAKMEGALAREREGLRAELRVERRQRERERKYVATAMERIEERQALEKLVWEKERESLEDEIKWKSEQAERQCRRARDALQERERVLQNLWEELAGLATRGRPTGERTVQNVELMEKERLKLEIWGEVERMDTEREKMEMVMFWEKGRNEKEIRKLRKQRDASKKLMALAVKQMEASTRQMQLAELQMEIAKKTVEEAVLEKECAEEELKMVKGLLEKEREEVEAATEGKRRSKAWFRPLVCCGKRED